MALSSELIDQLVKVTQNTEPRDKDNTAYGTVVIMGSKKYVKIDGSDLMTPVSSTVAVENGDRVIVTIRSHSATVTGNTSSPAASDKKVTELGTKISDFEIVIADKVSAKELDVQIGRIDELTADNATIKESLTANKAKIDDLTAKNAEITGTLEANKAKIDDLDAKKLDAEVADIKYASIDRLDATDANLRNLKSDYAQFEKTTTGELEATNAKIDGLDTKYANVDFSNIGKAAIEQFYATSGIIKDLVVGDQTITGELVGITITGDLIKGNTIVADKLVIKGSDGLYYKLNTDGVTTEKEQTEYNSLNGQIIQAKSITATKIDVKDLVAFGATIGGFNIGQDSIFSGVKETVDNKSRGIYMDKNGQIAIGDVNNYIKYFKDTDGRYRLKISAASLEFNASGDSGEESKDLETVIKDINDKVDGIAKTNKGIGSITNYYLATSESSDVTTETAGWTTKIQNVSSSKKYLWNYEVTKYTDDTIANTTEPCIIGMYSAVGATGNGIQKITEYYALSALKDSVPTVWSENVPNLTATNKYLWNYEKILYTNGGTELTKKRIIGVYGDTGKDGAKGEDGYSPTATVSKNGDTTTITIVDKTGTHTQTVKDGTNGTPGKDGINGKTTYFHVKYSNDGGKTFTSNSGETVGSYIGTCTNYTEADPTTVGSYVWAKIKGEKGDTGKSIGSVINYYLATSASSGVSTSTSGWTTAVQNVTLEKKYLWNYEVVKYTDGTVASTTSPCIIGTYGDTGKTGATGKNALQVLKQWNGTYTTIGQEVNCPTDRFNRIPVTGDMFTNVDASSNLGTWQITKVADGQAYFKMVSYVSAKGATGATGNGIKNIKEHYAVSTSNTVTPTSWLDDVPVTNPVNKYLWNYETITYTNGTSVDSKKRVIGVYGDTGKDGAKGEDGDDFRWNLVKGTNVASTAGWSANGWAGSFDTLSKDERTYKFVAVDGWHVARYVNLKEYVGQNVTISFYAKNVSAETTATEAYSLFIANATGANPYVTGYLSNDNPVQDSWIYCSYTCKLNSDGQLGIGSFCRPEGKGLKSTWLIKDLKIELGSAATPWSPHPDDLVGADGKGIKSTAVTYQASTSGTVIPTGTWQTSIPTVSAGQYLWTRTVITYTDDSKSTSYSVGRMGTNGTNGSAGRGIKSTAITYQAGPSGTTAPTGTWQTTVPATSASSPYLWTRTIITYTDDTTSTSYAVGSTLEGVSVGGRNLLPKTHKTAVTYKYPTGTNYWDPWNSATTVPLNGDTYTLSFWAKSTVDGDKIIVHFYNPSNIISGKSSQGVTISYGDGRCPFMLSTTLTKYWVTYKIPAGGNSTRNIIIPRLYGPDRGETEKGTGEITVQWEKLEEGNIATDWTPAPEDGIASVDVEYYLSTSATALTGGSWSTAAPTWVNGKYMWSRTVTTDGAGNKTYSPNQNGVCIAGAKGETGAAGGTGADGKGVTSIVEQYYQSTSATALSGGSWSEKYPGWESGKYIWTRSVITYTDKTTTTTAAVCVTGEKGDGLDIKDTRATNESPNWYVKNYPKTTVMELKECQAIGLSNAGTYCNLQTIVLWSDNTVGYPRQTAKIEGTGKEYWRVGTGDTTWSPWIDPYGESLEAAKTATNFMEFTSGTGLQIGDKTNGTWKGFRSRITSTAFEILNEAGAAVASYGRKLIQLGKDSVDAIVELCGGKGNIKYATPENNYIQQGLALDRGLVIESVDNIIIKPANKFFVNTELTDSTTDFVGRSSITPGSFQLNVWQSNKGSNIINASVGIEGNIEEGLNLEATGGKYDFLEAIRFNNISLLDWIYPVGSIYMSAKEGNPALLFGGTWVAWGAGRVPVGFNGSDGNFNSSEKTGGSKTINIQHNHGLSNARAAVGRADSSLSTMSYTSGGNPHNVYFDREFSYYGGISGGSKHATDTSLIYGNTNNGGSTAASVLQPYIVCYMWKRTA